MKRESDVRHIILASHHRFAAGLADTIEFLGGPTDMDVICAYVDETPLEDQVAEVFAKFDPADEVLVFTDILQGSVNQRFAPYVGEHVFLIAGANVALTLELALAAEPLTCEGIEAARQLARQSMCLINTFQADVDDEDE